MVGVQPNIGKPIAFHNAAGLLAVQQNVIYGIFAVHQALYREHHAIFSFHEANGTRKIPTSRHNVIDNTRIIETPLSKTIELLFKFAICIMPHHNAPLSALAQWLRKALFQLLYYINLGHKPLCS